jgi:hypothetical protein
LSKLDPEPEDSVDAVEVIGDVSSNDKPLEHVVEEVACDVLGSSLESCDYLGSSQAVECYGGVNWDGLQIEKYS